MQLSPEKSQLIYLLISVAILISVSALYTKWRRQQEEEKTQCPKCGNTDLEWLNVTIFFENTKYRCKACDHRFWFPPRREVKPTRVSKTEMARSIARMKNVERSRSSMQKHRGSFKPKTAFEKQLWKPDKKPEED